MASPVSPRPDVPPAAVPPTLEELWAVYDRHLEKMLPPEIKVRLLAEKKKAEEKEAESQARMARWQEVQWRKAMEHSAWVEEDAEFLYKQAKGAKGITAAWTYQAKVYRAMESELAYAPTQSDQLVAEEPRRRRRPSPRALEGRREAGRSGIGGSVGG